MTVQCYICEKDIEISSIVKHLQGHTKLEASIAHRKALESEKKNAAREEADDREGP